MIVDPFDRGKHHHLLYPVRQTVRVPQDRSLSPSAQFAMWIDALPPKSCERHLHTNLELDRTESEEFYRRQRGKFADAWPPPPDPKELEEIYRKFPSWRRLVDSASVPEVPTIEFTALFHPCIACKVAYSCAPPEFVETNFDGFEPRTPELKFNLARCCEFAVQVNSCGCGFALLCGSNGNGKTRLACNIIRELENPDALYIRQGTLTTALRASYGRKDVFLHRRQRGDDEDAGDDDPPAPLEIVQAARFLVLDEIGCCALANDERLQLDELIKDRYERRKPTILISNLALSGSPEKPGLKQFLGDALADRIMHAAGNGRFILQFSGESYRRTNGENYLDGLG